MTINGSDITMFCGDTEAFHVSCKMNGVIRQFVAGDKVYFTVKEYETKTDKDLIGKRLTQSKIPKSDKTKQEQKKRTIKQ